MNASEQKIATDTIVRTIVLALALVNQILATRGHSALPFTENDVYQIVSLGWTIVASVMAWWKNNSFTCLACQADAWIKKQQNQTTQENSK